MTSKPTLLQNLVQRAPDSIKPYLSLLRIDRPIGSWLLFLPCSWSLAIAAKGGCFPDPYLLFLFGSGAIIMRGAGCIINDIWDKDLDKKVERTKERPLASGQLSTQQALLLLGSQLSIGLTILMQFSSWFAVGLGLLSTPLYALYPGVKRISYWPQLVLGFTFNWGALLGYAAVHGTLDLPVVLPLYIAGICWTLHYDTVYAHQDKKDDALVGIKSTALRFGEHTKQWLSFFVTVTISSLYCAGYMSGLGWPFYVMMGVSAAHLAWQIKTLDINDEKDCGAKFRSNKIFGALVFVAIVLGKLFSPIV